MKPHQLPSTKIGTARTESAACELRAPRARRRAGRGRCSLSDIAATENLGPAGEVGGGPNVCASRGSSTVVASSRPTPSRRAGIERGRRPRDRRSRTRMRRWRRSPRRARASARPSLRRRSGCTRKRSAERLTASRIASRLRRSRSARSRCSRDLGVREDDRELAGDVDENRHLVLAPFARPGAVEPENAVSSPLRRSGTSTDEATFRARSAVANRVEPGFRPSRPR